MMRGLVIATNGDMRVQTFTAPALEDVQKVVGGWRLFPSATSRATTC